VLVEGDLVDASPDGRLVREVGLDPCEQPEVAARVKVVDCARFLKDTQSPQYPRP
jgi:hypothetical protein